MTVRLSKCFHTQRNSTLELENLISFILTLKKFEDFAFTLNTREI